MTNLKAGDRARIVDTPPKGRHLLRQIVVVAQIGGFGVAPDDVAVITAGGGMLLLKAHQLSPA